MKLTTLWVVSIAVVAMIGPPAAARAGWTEGPEGLVKVHSRYLDSLALRPGAELRRYRGVLIEPPQVTMHEEWLRDMNYGRGAARKVTPEDERRIVGDAASSLMRIVAEAYRAKGFEVVTAPGPGVLRLVPRVSELYVNALDAMESPGTRTFTREAGEATLILEARDSVSGPLLARVEHRERPTAVGGFSRSSDVSTRFWFDSLFDRWAANSAAEFVAARAEPPATRSR